MNLKERGVTVGDLLIILIIIISSIFIFKSVNNNNKQTHLLNMTNYVSKIMI